MGTESDFKLWQNMNLEEDTSDLFAGTSLHSPNVNLSGKSGYIGLFRYWAENWRKHYYYNLLIFLSALCLLVYIAKYGQLHLTIFWVVAFCSLVKVHPRFGGTYCHHHHGQRVSRISNKHEARRVMSRRKLSTSIVHPERE
jgi:hypothetical protein